MALKKIVVAEIGEIHVLKKRGNKNLRLSIDSRGRVRVSIPTWLPYGAAVKYVHTKKDWLAKHQNKQHEYNFNDGLRVGKSYRLKTADVKSPRISGTNILIPLQQSPETENKIVLACERALKLQSENLLAERLRLLAKKHNLQYRSLSVKKMRSRWGSCSNRNEINLSIFLIQLPWELIDYVILHELAHTVHHNHSSDFWELLGGVFPATKSAKKRLREFQTALVLKNDSFMQ